MADCSYARCIQERRFIKRELQKWTKNMVYIVGLERVAEELMGRRKWKQFQDLITRSNINIDATNLTQKSVTSPVVNNGHHHTQNSQESHEITDLSPQTIAETENKYLQLDNSIENQEKQPESDQSSKVVKIKKEIKATESELDEKADIKKETVELDDNLQKPIDWKPQDKCYFCVDGKLLKVNEAGELVAEAGPVQSEAELTNRTLNDSDSESSESERNICSKLATEQSKNIAAFLRQAQGLQQPGMTSFEQSMAAQLAAVASLGGLQPGLAPFYPANLGLWYGLQQQQQQQQPSAIVQKPSESPQSPSLSDHHQPLPNSSSSPLAKELLGTSSGEQPLDLSAKSGTSGNPEPKTIFKAKPRLTTSVPNKRAYTEEELQNALRDILSGKLGTRRAAVIYGIPRSTLRNKVYKYTMENRQQIPRPEVVLPSILDDDDDDDTGGDNDSDRPAETPTPTPAEEMMRLQAAALQSFMKEEQQTQKPTPPVMPPLLDANLLLQLQTLLLGGGLGTLPGMLAVKPDDVAALPEVLRKLMMTQQEFMKHSAESNGQPYLNLLQQQQQYLQKMGSKSEEEEQSESGGDDLVPIRIPSYKPGPGCSSGGNKNNGDVMTTPPPPALRPVVPNSLHPNHHLPVTSPPLRAHSDSQSPPQPLSHKSMLSLSEVIAKSISKNFQEQKHHAPTTLDIMEQYKRPNISVIKSLGSVERFGQSPSNMSANMSPGSNTGTGGKGTRPKRGKYRNYDRDSLVEAVKAVQRGEMSVHRAGSYYGVPHSTLEYKVKERHLMRPRKREPKPQPLDGTSSSSTGVPKSPASSASLLDKSKMMPTTAKPPLKTPPFPSTSPNGMKVPPMFDSAMAQMQYPSPFMWPPHNFPMHATDFASRAGTTASQQPPTFPPNADSIFTQHMIQRLQEERGNKNGQPKSTRELAESLYDASSTNGSFLDGIIRHSLQDKKPGEMNHGALFDQLVKNNRLAEPTDPAALAAAAVAAVHGNKRSGSPLSFAQTDIKRERASPDGGSTSDDQKDDLTKEAVENLIKLREGLSLKMEPKQDQDLNNGSSTGTNDDAVRTDDSS